MESGSEDEGVASDAGVSTAARFGVQHMVRGLPCHGMVHICVAALPGTHSSAVRHGRHAMHAGIEDPYPPLPLASSWGLLAAPAVRAAFTDTL